MCGVDRSILHYELLDLLIIYCGNQRALLHSTDFVFTSTLSLFFFGFSMNDSRVM